MKDKIILYLKKYLDLNKFSNFTEKIIILNSKSKNFGDFNTNLAIIIAKKNNKDPLIIANEIKEYLLKISLFKDITITKPGFINFFINEKEIIKYALSYFDKNYHDKFNTLQKLKINYEFVSANPTGYLHLGHARHAIIGETTVMILKYVGHNVIREYYINDAGVQIDNLANSIYNHALIKLNIKNNDQDNSQYNGYEIIDYASYLAKNHQDLFINKNKEQAIIKIKKLAVDHFLEEIKKDLKALNVADYDIFTSDKKLIEDKKVDKILAKFQKSKYYYKKDDAIWIKTSAFGDPKDRVLIKKDLTYTYMVADFANHVKKYQGGYDLMIDLWGADHHGYEARIKAGLEILGYDSNKLKIDYITLVKLLENGQEFKMSKRKGTAIRIREILDLIDVPAFKFSILAKAKSQMHAIDIAKVNKKDINNNIYWYIQYANSRINQLLNKVEAKTITNLKLKNDYLYLGKEQIEQNLLLKIIAFADQILQAANNREPLILINYLKELAQAFHAYYNSCKIINENKEIEEERLLLIISLKNLFERIFNILKIEPIKKM